LIVAKERKNVNYSTAIKEKGKMPKKFSGAALLHLMGS
jgi:hypothetical protein